MLALGIGLVFLVIGALWRFLPKAPDDQPDDIREIYNWKKRQLEWRFGPVFLVAGGVLVLAGLLSVVTSRN